MALGGSALPVGSLFRSSIDSSKPNGYWQEVDFSPRHRSDNALSERARGQNVRLTACTHRPRCYFGVPAVYVRTHPTGRFRTTRSIQ